MTITVTIPVLDRTSPTFKTDLDTFFLTTFPAFAAQANALAADVSAKQALASTAGALAQTAIDSGLANAAENASIAANAAQTATTAAGVAQSAADSIKDGPVTSVNGQTGIVVLSMENHAVNFSQGVI